MLLVITKLLVHVTSTREYKIRSDPQRSERATTRRARKTTSPLVGIYVHRSPPRTSQACSASTPFLPDAIRCTQPHAPMRNMPNAETRIARFLRRYTRSPPFSSLSARAARVGAGAPRAEVRIERVSGCGHGCPVCARSHAPVVPREPRASHAN
jgi:hypothetical protein